MATAIGVYAALAAVKIRLGIADASADGVLQPLCDQVNDFIEEKTERVIAPIVAGATTLTAQANAGQASLVVASSANFAAGKAVLVGDLAGVKEQGVVAAVPDGTHVTLTANLGGTYAIGKAVTECYLYDGFDSATDGLSLRVPEGIRSVTLLEAAQFTGGTFAAIPVGQFFLRPAIQRRKTGWPADTIELTNYPSSANLMPVFFDGYDNIRLVAALGWPATPDSLSGLAQKLVVRLYKTRGTAGGAPATTGTDGTQTVAMALEDLDWRLLRSFMVNPIAVG